MLGLGAVARRGIGSERCRRWLVDNHAGTARVQGVAKGRGGGGVARGGGEGESGGAAARRPLFEALQSLLVAVQRLDALELLLAQTTAAARFRTGCGVQGCELLLQMQRLRTRMHPCRLQCGVHAHDAGWGAGQHQRDPALGEAGRGEQARAREDPLQ